MKQLLVNACVLSALGCSFGCTDRAENQALRSLSRGGAVSFVCLSDAQARVNGRGEITSILEPGRDLDHCPDYEDDGETLRLHALVTQTLRGEVAVIDLSEEDEEMAVVDADPTTPGFGFLTVGANPVDIVTTPGGAASFVTIAEGPGRSGVLALPSSCVRAPIPTQSRRDLTTWPGCALDSPPGRMQLLLDGDPERGKTTCDGSSVPNAGPRECPADLTREQGPQGRRKLAVALPDEGAIVILDAQELLDRPQGSFAPCQIESRVSLQVELPTEPPPRQVPEDLVPNERDGTSCALPDFNHGPAPEFLRPRPHDLGEGGGVLFVSDLAAPVIHRVDVADPCRPKEGPPLLPSSYEDPKRVVTTKAIAVSPLTSLGERWVYAVDDREGSVMVFDVTPGRRERTPVLRSGSPELPYEPADRLVFDAPARDLEFIVRDVPEEDLDTGVATAGLLCDPNPSKPSDSDDPQVRYRPNRAFTSGANPLKLRGTFAFVALANGRIAVVDIDDFDRPCRRPVQVNQGEIVDHRGCARDAAKQSYRDSAGEPTTSGELSCNVIEPHRTRLDRPFIVSKDAGIRAPSLRSFPRLRSEEGGNIPTDQSEEALSFPKLLAVDYEDGTPAELYLGTDLFRSGENLVTNPLWAEHGSVAFRFNEPRSFLVTDEISVVFEGVVLSQRPAGLLKLDAHPSGAQLDDADGRFCDRGVQSLRMLEEDEVLLRGLGVAGEQRHRFALLHADYVQVQSEIVGEDEDYWIRDGKSCGGGDGNGFLLCEEEFGTLDEPGPARDLVILDANQDHLVLEPRDSADPARTLDMLSCCFGGEAVAYTIRAGNHWIVRSESMGFEHHVTTAGPDAEEPGRCIQDCNPRLARLNGRAFEVTLADRCDRRDRNDCLACVLEGLDTYGTTGIDPASGCVFESLNTRFAIYRGTQPSERGMQFEYQYTGGTRVLAADLRSVTSEISPQSMVFVPQIQHLAVPDGAANGMALVSIESLTVSRYFY